MAIIVIILSVLLITAVVFDLFYHFSVKSKLFGSKKEIRKQEKKLTFSEPYSKPVYIILLIIALCSIIFLFLPTNNTKEVSRIDRLVEEGYYLELDNIERTVTFGGSGISIDQNQLRTSRISISWVANRSIDVVVANEDGDILESAEGSEGAIMHLISIFGSSETVYVFLFNFEDSDVSLDYEVKVYYSFLDGFTIFLICSLLAVIFEAFLNKTALNKLQKNQAEPQKMDFSSDTSFSKIEHTQEKRDCSYCGCEIGENWVYCGNCGNKN